MIRHRCEECGRPYPKPKKLSLEPRIQGTRVTFFGPAPRKNIDYWKDAFCAEEGSYLARDAFDPQWDDPLYDGWQRDWGDL